MIHFGAAGLRMGSCHWFAAMDRNSATGSERTLIQLAFSERTTEMSLQVGGPFDISIGRTEHAAMQFLQMGRLGVDEQLVDRAHRHISIKPKLTPMRTLDR